MAYQSIFKRYELKYLLTADQKAAVLAAMAPHMAPDRYGCTTIRNIYFDTDNYRLIRRSLDRPLYKEKLRLRSYRPADDDTPVFVELKKKYNGIVYKRRVSMELSRALDWLEGRQHCPEDTQIIREIDSFMAFYETLRPTVFLSYDRVAYYCEALPDFRVTFDENILCRREDICLNAGIYGTPLLPAGMTLMEIKCAGGVPLWMTKILTQQRIFKTSYSKYGTAYRQMIFPNYFQEVKTNA